MLSDCQIRLFKKIQKYTFEQNFIILLIETVVSKVLFYHVILIANLYHLLTIYKKLAEIELPQVIYLFQHIWGHFLSAKTEINCSK